MGSKAREMVRAKRSSGVAGPHCISGIDRTGKISEFDSTLWGLHPIQNRVRCFRPQDLFWRPTYLPASHDEGHHPIRRPEYLLALPALQPCAQAVRAGLLRARHATVASSPVESRDLSAIELPGLLTHPRYPPAPDAWRRHRVSPDRNPN